MQHFSEEIDVDGLIRRSGLSKAYFHSCFKDMTGTTPGRMLTNLRLDKAKSLLCITRSPVGEIAAACGFTDHVYFSSVFKKHTGLTPTEYRECQLKAGGRNGRHGAAEDVLEAPAHRQPGLAGRILRSAL